jgi:GAF domain-containing protein/HAMP domain-containing protein
VVERAYRWLPQVGMLLITEQESAEAFREQARSSSIYAAAALLGIAVAFAGAYFLTHSISDPIRRLNQTVGQISAGNLGIQAQVPTQDEISGLARSFNQMAAQLQRMVGTLEMRVDERTRQLTRRNTQFETVAEVGGAIAAIRQIDALLTQVTRLISQRFGFYHVGIFLLDENGEYAVLRAANSEGGQRMLARSHRLKIGQVGIVGYVAGALQPRIALDVGQDAVFFNNPDLPQTRSEMALPLIAAGELLGVLDVQSTEANAFTQEDVQVLQLLANQVAVAIQNASLFSRAQEALETARRSYGEISQRAWLDLLNRQQITPLVRSRGRAQAGGSDSEHGAASVNGDGRRLAIPIRVRDLVIGTLEPYKPAGMGDWTAEELEALETVAGQLGVALDSARLYEETQIKAENERISGEIAARMRATLDIDSVLQTAVREMQHALKLAEVEIRLGTFTSPAPESRESHEG